MRKLFLFSILALSLFIFFSFFLIKKSTKKDALPNVLIITIDTLRADHLPVYGYKKVETPNINAFKKDSIIFEDASAHSPVTLPSHTSIMSGTYPVFHGVRANGIFHVSDKVVTAAEIFKNAGYNTSAFVGSFVLGSRFGLSQGFDLYDDDMTDGNEDDFFHYKERKAEKVIQKATAWLDKRYGKKTGEAPFFLWAHLFDPHNQYYPPEPYKSRYKYNLYDTVL